MSEYELVEELSKFGTRTVKRFGQDAGGEYVRRCLVAWEEEFGAALAAKVKERMSQYFPGETK